MSTYIVTGAAGFIGSNVSDALLLQGHQVVGVDNLSAAYDVRMKEHRLEKLLPHPAFTFLKADITDRAIIDQLTQAVPHAQAVINLAAMAGVRQSMSDPWSYLYTNTLGTLNMLEYTRRQEVPKFILASTSSLYGADGTQPHSELDPTDRPLAPYAASKKGAEAFAYSYHHLYGIDTSIVRYFTVYGPAGRPDMSMFRFCQWIAEGRPVLINGSGEQSRGFTYVDDIAAGTLLALKNVGYEVFNLGGHEVMSINAVIELIEQLLGKKATRVYAPVHPADVFSNVADVSKARAMLGWQPRVGLQEGVQNLVDWYLANRSWAKDIITD
jgi:nucleoside-diphosphate-sugar epimerase